MYFEDEEDDTFEFWGGPVYPEPKVKTKEQEQKERKKYWEEKKRILSVNLDEAFKGTDITEAQKKLLKLMRYNLPNEKSHLINDLTSKKYATAFIKAYKDEFQKNYDEYIKRKKAEAEFGDSYYDEDSICAEAFSEIWC